MKTLEDLGYTLIKETENSKRYKKRSPSNLFYVVDISSEFASSYIRTYEDYLPCKLTHEEWLAIAEEIRKFNHENK